MNIYIYGLIFCTVILFGILIYAFKKRKTIAIEGIKKQAEKGVAEAQYIIGGLYIIGERVPKDIPLGISWLTKAAENNFAAAQSSLGNMYFEGKFVEKNNEFATKWFMLAAMNGDVISQKIVAGVYDFTLGMDRKIAFAWYSVASENDDAYSKERADLILSELRDTDKVKALQLADEYRKKYYKKHTSVVTNG